VASRGLGLIRALQKRLTSTACNRRNPQFEQKAPMPKKASSRIPNETQIQGPVFGTHLGLTLPDPQTKPDFRGF